LGSSDLSVAADFVLLFPISLIKDLDRLLEFGECVRSSEVGDFVFEMIWESFVVLSDKGNVIPTGAEGMVVEIKGILDCFPGVAVTEVFKGNGCVGDGVLETE